MHFNNTTYYSRTRFTGCLILLSVEGAVGGFLWLISDLVGSEKGGDIRHLPLSNPLFSGFGRFFGFSSKFPQIFGPFDGVLRPLQ